jgi:hypothetical protein
MPEALHGEAKEAIPSIQAEALQAFPTFSGLSPAIADSWLSRSTRAAGVLRALQAMQAGGQAGTQASRQAGKQPTQVKLNSCSMLEQAVLTTSFFCANRVRLPLVLLCSLVFLKAFATVHSSALPAYVLHPITTVFSLQCTRKTFSQLRARFSTISKHPQTTHTLWLKTESESAQNDSP